MEPTSIYIALKASLDAGKALKAADAKVAACAAEQGISKEEVWVGIRAEARRRNDKALESALDLADPLGWRAAARAMKQAELEQKS